MPSYTVHVGPFGGIKQIIGETDSGQWLDIDRLLVQLWESRSIRPKVMCTAKKDMGDRIGSLLPEVTERGIIDLAEYSAGQDMGDRIGRLLPKITGGGIIDHVEYSPGIWQ
jgi:hypothetical protein